ncbi:terminase [Elizabethkingia anophelis]|nr:terminase [Elizabethkingia anophelis]MDV4026182.1 terminase [Elizabethkingia anophelis]
MGKGAPTKYLEVYNDQVYKLCLLGATDKEIADFFNVCEATINNWKNEHPSFLESIKAGKQIADYNVANRLYQRALGFEHDSEEIKIVEGSIERVPIKKIYPPDPTSAIFWLKNRQPAKWRDKQEVEQSGNLNISWNEEKTYEK